MQTQTKISLDDIVSYQSIPKRFPDLYSEKSWAWAVKQRHHNGLAKAFRKVGKNLLVITPVLVECIKEMPSD
jgi:hypothetical protein